MIQTPWPSWMSTILPSWLENIGYPSTGIGDLDDLKFTIGLGPQGQWYGYVNPGWFYHYNHEQYSYNFLGEQLIYGTSAYVVPSSKEDWTIGPLFKGNDTLTFSTKGVVAFAHGSSGFSAIQTIDTLAPNGLPLDVMFVIDQSGSMFEIENGDYNANHIKNLAIQLSSNILLNHPGSRIAAISFDGYPGSPGPNCRIDFDWTSDFWGAMNGIANVYQRQGGETWMKAGLQLARSHVASSAVSQPLVILMSDGGWTIEPGWSDDGGPFTTWSDIASGHGWLTGAVYIDTVNRNTVIASGYTLLSSMQAMGAMSNFYLPIAQGPYLAMPEGAYLSTVTRGPSGNLVSSTGVYDYQSIAPSGCVTAAAFSSALQYPIRGDRPLSVGAYIVPAAWPFPTDSTVASGLQINRDTVWTPTDIFPYAPLKKLDPNQYYQIYFYFNDGHIYFGDNGGDFHITVTKSTNDPTRIEYSSDPISFRPAWGPIIVRGDDSTNQQQVDVVTHGTSAPWPSYVMQAAKNLSAQYARCGSDWRFVETATGFYNWYGPDWIVTQVTGAGITPWMTVGYNNALYASSAAAPITGTTNVNAYLAYCEQLWTRYGGKGFVWELLNETDQTTFWTNPSASWYTSLLISVINYRNTYHPNEQLAILNCATFNYSYITTVLTGLTAAIPASGLHNIWIAPHAYTHTPENIVSDWATLTSTIDGVFTIAASNIVVGEMSFPAFLNPAPSGTTQTDYSASLWTTWLRNAKTANIPRIFAYVLNNNDAGNDPATLIGTVMYDAIYSATRSNIYNYPFIQHYNSYYPAADMVWSQIGSTNIYSAVVPPSCMLVSMRDLTNVPMGSVAGTGSLTSNKFYFYDIPNSKVYIRSDNGLLNYYADLIYFYPRLQMRECVVVTDGTLKTSYKKADGLTVSRGGQSYYYSGTTVGAITNPVTGLYNGDWVVLEYWVPNSFILENHNLLKLYSNLQNKLTVHYETALPYSTPPLKLIDGTKLNLNPLFFDAYRTGYLFHTASSDPVSSFWTPKNINLRTDKSAVCAQWHEPVKVTGLLSDTQGLPIPWYPIHCTHSSGTVIVATPSTGLNLTDGRGEFHALILPAANASSFWFTATASGVSSTVTVSLVASGSQLNSSKYHSGLVNLIVGSDVNQLGTQKISLNSTYLDGLPKPSDTLSIQSKRSSSFYYLSTFFNGSISGINTAVDLVSNNPMGVNSLDILPQTTETLIVFNPTTQSKRVDVPYGG